MWSLCSVIYVPVMMYAVHLFFCCALWRYETDGTVESPDEILSFLSMCDCKL